MPQANAIGENDEAIRELLRQKYKKDLTIKQGIKLALDIFKEVKNDKFDLEKFELAYLKTDDSAMKRAEGKDIEKV